MNEVLTKNLTEEQAELMRSVGEAVMRVVEEIRKMAGMMARVIKDIVNSEEFRKFVEWMRSFESKKPRASRALRPPRSMPPPRPLILDRRIRLHVIRNNC